jgi:hypothetical protein
MKMVLPLDWAHTNQVEGEVARPSIDIADQARRADGVPTAADAAAVGAVGQQGADAIAEEDIVVLPEPSRRAKARGSTLTSIQEAPPCVRDGKR